MIKIAFPEKFALYLIIFLGLLLRFLYPFFANPMDHLVSDALRHYENACSWHFATEIHSLLDPPLPQWWLRSVLFVFGDTKFGAGISNGILCAITPWLWYRWGREIFSTKTQALVFMAILAFLPSWISIYAYFMDETLALPALGAALWLSWRAHRKATAKAVLLASAAWGVAIAIKLNLAVELFFVLPWLLIAYLKKNSSNFGTDPKSYAAVKSNATVKSYATVIGSIAILSFAYALHPLWIYQGLKSTWLFPPGFAAINRIYYGSGARAYTGTINSRNGTFWDIGFFESPSMNEKSFEPLFKWKTCRHGKLNMVINCDQPISLMLPARINVDPPNTVNQSCLKSWQYIAEGALHFFFGPSWPDDRRNDLFQTAQVEMRWVWSLLTLFIVILAIQKKQLKEILVLLCLGTALISIFGSSAVIEARYRKPWEGIAIATFIFLSQFNSQNRPKKLTD